MFAGLASLSAQEANVEAQTNTGTVQQTDGSSQPEAEQAQLSAGDEQAAADTTDSVANTANASGNQEAKEEKQRPKDKSWFDPQNNHNPMMSPKDYDDIRKAEQARIEAERAAKLEAERAARAQLAGDTYNPITKVVRKKIDPLKIIDRKLRIQGIMGSMVIINGDAYSPGDTIARTGGAKVKTIGGNYIIIEYKGKTLRKVMKEK